MVPNLVFTKLLVSVCCSLMCLFVVNTAPLTRLMKVRAAAPSARGVRPQAPGRHIRLRVGYAFAYITPAYGFETASVPKSGEAMSC